MTNTTPLPRFVDLQVAGYAGVDFLGEPISDEQLHHAAARMRQHEVRVALPTMGTDTLSAMVGRLANMRKLIDADPELASLYPAFHIEGPCLSTVEGYRGAHDPGKMLPASSAVFEPIIEAAGGWDRIAIVTLAPEVDRDMATTRWLAEHGVTVALGHTDASREELRDAVAAGATLFTHLGNGCANEINRHDNIINRAMATEGLSYTLIADGHHVPLFVLERWIRWLGVERCIFITDAVAPAGGEAGQYPFLGFTVDYQPGGPIRFPGTPYLAGSGLTMPIAYQHAVGELGLTEAEAAAVCCGNAAKVLGIDIT